jgi:hypothetical protein
MDPPPAPHSTSYASAMEALDDPLLLRIFGATMDATIFCGAEEGDDAQKTTSAVAAARARHSSDGADDNAWHPAHLARLACVSRCVTAPCARACMRAQRWRF